MVVISFDRRSPVKWTESLSSWYEIIPYRGKKLTDDDSENHSVDASEVCVPPEVNAYFMVDLRQSSVAIDKLSPRQIDDLGVSGLKLKELPQLNIHCLNSSGKTALLNVVGVFPYFYARPTVADPDVVKIKQSLDKFMQSVTQGLDGLLKVEIVLKESLMGFKGRHGLESVVKITLCAQYLVPKLREAIRRREIPGFDGQSFEGNIPFELRMMIDIGLRGCSWFTVPNKYITNASPGDLIDEYLNSGEAALGHFDVRNQPVSDVGDHIPLLDVCAMPMEEDQWSIIPPQIRILSFDIECTTLGRKGFPKAEQDPVIAISLVLKEFSGLIIHKAVLCLRETAAIADGTIVWFSHEEDLLIAFCEYVRITDPDFLTGYNCFNFDLNYLIDRSVALKIQGEFGYLSRVPGFKSTVENARLSSKGLGIKDYKNIDVPGRICLDVLEAIRKEHKLKSYSLNAVSAHFLEQQKEDVHYSIIGTLFEGTPETRRRIASYCMKDSILPLNLLQKLMIVVNMVEMARVTGVPITYLITRGQQIKVTSQILRHCRQTSFIMPATSRDPSGDKYEGATVLEPKKALYSQPITTLDFASLYPSIMIAHNLCYSTLIQPAYHETAHRELSSDDITRTPVGCEFVKASVRQGILPSIVGDLISARKRARALMANTSDQNTKMVLNGRQLALKISANSVYGYTGAASAGQLPCLEVSTSITAFGRQMIDKTKELVEDRYTIKNGYKSNADVIYGDTDSVMVDFGVDSIQEGMQMGEEAASLVSKEFISPIKLEFEKVFCPYLLMNKKRYAGLLYSKSHLTWDKMDCKGIETVRRDFCSLVQISVDTVLKKILVDKDVNGAQQYVRGVITDLMMNKIDMSLLVMTKSIGKEDYSAKLAHVELAKRIRERDPGNAPQVGDRVHYVIIAKGKNVPQYERAEDPSFVIENNLSIDTAHYLDSLKNPLCRILEPCMGKDAEALFTSGDHTMSIVKNFSHGGALSKFMGTKKILRCLGCRVSLTDASGGQLCKNCEGDKGAEVTASTFKDLADIQVEFNRLWTQCQNCQGSLMQDVLCTSRDCPIFYRRSKVRKDLEKAEQKCEGLHESW
eukprot:GHVH01006426.1.p1 GENE.GHVH01006426.1~~GHVH01006426.1.p1  ORF type:complete len:1089 (+),score=158.43 GHVH01006426.1:102-3368(+)